MVQLKDGDGKGGGVAIGLQPPNPNIKSPMRRCQKHAPLKGVSRVKGDPLSGKIEHQIKFL
jgi:hypothetical protein